MAPRLSVVVPIYNVERYLEECLDSIAAQTFGDFECVMVDDGSTDTSAVIAKEYAAKDSRFRLVQQENQGLGAARNTGRRHFDEGTEYLAFVDSDDTLPPNAYELMIGTLDETGSDFAAGNALRFRAAGYYQSHAHSKPFRETRLKTHVTEIPSLVTDRTAWNKVYRRSFFDRPASSTPRASSTRTPRSACRTTTSPPAWTSSPSRSTTGACARTARCRSRSGRPTPRA